MGAAGTAELLSDVTTKIVKYSTPFGYAWLVEKYMFVTSVKSLFL